MKFMRWKGFLPFLIIAVVGYVFTTYYLDSFLRKTLVKQGTRLNGALVEVDRLRLSFVKSRLEIRGIRVTHSQDLMKNRVDVGSVVADLQFWPLLKKKFVIDDFQVKDVKVSTPRKSEGAIPPAWAKAWEQENTSEEVPLWMKALEEMKSNVQAKLPDVDLDELGDKFNPKKFVTLGELEVYQSAKAIPGETKRLVSEWRGKSDRFVKVQKAELSQLRSKVNSFHPDKLKTAPQILQAIKTCESLESDIQKQKTSIVDLAQNAKGDLNKQAKAITGLKRKMDEDIDRLKKKIGFGNLKMDKLSEGVFGPSVIERYQEFLRYYMLAKMYLEKYQGTKGEEKKARGRGRTVYFPVTDGVPTFLLAHIGLSGDTRGNQDVPEAARGAFALEGADFSSHPQMWGKPMVADFTADMAGGDFAKAALGFRHEEGEAKKQTKVQGKISGFRFQDIFLGKKSVFAIPLRKGEADWKSEVLIVDDTVKASIAGNFKRLAYAFPKGKKVHPVLKVLQEVIQEMRAFSVRVGFSGDLTHPKFSISSTFDQALRRGLERTLMRKVRQAQAKLEAYLRKEIGGKIAEGEKVLRAQKKKLLNELATQQRRVDDLKKLIKRRLNDLKTKQTQMIKGKTDAVKKKASGAMKGAGGDLKKKLGF